jgi:hypothetical protein
VGSCGLDASSSGWGPVVGSCEHSNILTGSIKGGNFLTSWVTISFSRALLHGTSQLLVK